MAIVKNMTVIANGYSLADAITSLSFQANQEELDATVIANDFRSFETGFKDGSLSLNGIFDSDTTNADKIHDVLSSVYDSGATIIVTTSLGAVTVGATAIMMDGCVLKYDIPHDVGALILSNAEFRANTGINFGVWLMNELVTEETETNASVDNTAATTNGGLFQAQWQNDDATGIRIIVQHSTDNAAWVDLAEVISGVRATGTYTIGVNPTAADTIIFNGVTFTFIAGVSTATDIQIKATLALTIAEAVTVLNASVNASVTVATYTGSATQITVTHDEPGTDGNAYTLGTNTANIVRSGATLAGGVNAVADEHSADSVTVAPGTTVRRYLRAVAIVDGGSTVLVSAAFARR